MSTENKHLVITGAGGLLGARALELLSGRYEIHALVRSKPKQPFPGVEYYEVDFSSNWSTSMLPKRVDAIFHLAQSSHAKEFPECAQDIFYVNTLSTAILLNYARIAGAKHFILASTGGLYSSDGNSITESSPISPSRGALGFYFDTKLCSEILVQAYADILNIVIFRPFFIYGPGQQDAMLIPRIIGNVSTGTPIQVVGECGIKLNPVYVDDVVETLEKSLQLKGARTMNIAGPQVVSIKEMATTIGKLLGIAPVFEEDEGIPASFVADNGLMKSLLDRPLVSFDDGIKCVVSED